MKRAYRYTIIFIILISLVCMAYLTVRNQSLTRPSVQGKLLIDGGRVMELHTFNAEASRHYADVINDFQAKLNPKVKVYSLIAPTQIEIVGNRRYRSLSASQKHTIGYVQQHLNKSIVTVDAYGAIRSHSKEYLYFRSDHHWTATGAYYAYTALMKARGEQAIPLAQYQSSEVGEYMGSLYSATLDETVKKNPDTIVLYHPFTPHRYEIYYQTDPVLTDILDMRHASNNNKYGIFLSGDSPWAKVSTEVGNGRRIVVIKDSYANAFVPFLLPHYEEIYLVDPRQFSQNIIQFISEKGIQEALFLNYALVTEYKGFADLIAAMTTK